MSLNFVCVWVPARKRALDGQDSEQTSAPPLLVQVSWALGAGFPLGRHFTASEKHTSPWQPPEPHVCMHTSHEEEENRVGAYRCNLSCSSGVSVRVDTHIRSYPGCLCSCTHSFHCWCCTHRYLRPQKHDSQSVLPCPSINPLQFQNPAAHIITRSPFIPKSHHSCCAAAPLDPCHMMN